jgi:hypothetical protein
LICTKKKIEFSRFYDEGVCGEKLGISEKWVCIYRSAVFYMVIKTLDMSGTADSHAL